MDNQRLFDLVRHQRVELFTAELITKDEYAELAMAHSAVARLEDYDTTRAEAAMLREALNNSLKRWITLIESGDAGSWDVDTDETVVAIRAALSGSSGEWLERQLAEARRKALLGAAKRARKVGLETVALDLEAMAKEADHGA